jgi:SsrA-binding protein
MARKRKERSANPVLAKNRAARHEFHILEVFEAGIELLGTEVKSAREGRVNLKEAYGKVKNGEVFLVNSHISPYTHGNRENHDPLRPRKLLLHRREIGKLAKAVETAGLTLVPLAMILKGGLIKLEIAIAKGKKLHDKREDSRKREAEREIARETGRRR